MVFGAYSFEDTVISFPKTSTDQADRAKGGSGRIWSAFRFKEKGTHGESLEANLLVHSFER